MAYLESGSVSQEFSVTSLTMICPFPVQPVDLTAGSLVNDKQATIPTVTDNLYAQGRIPENVLGIYYAPFDTADTSNGELTFGGFDSAKITSSVSFVPITKTAPSKYYWGIDQSISYGKISILPLASGIVDTGQ